VVAGFSVASRSPGWRHSGGGRDAGLRAFEAGEPLLERSHGGIGEARIDVSGALLQNGPRLERHLEHEARSEVEPLGVLVELARWMPERTASVSIS